MTDTERLFWGWALSAIGKESREAHTRLNEARHRREDAILEAWEKGVPTSELMEITGMSQANVARAKRRARHRRSVS